MNSLQQNYLGGDDNYFYREYDNVHLEKEIRNIFYDVLDEFKITYVKVDHRCMGRDYISYRSDIRESSWMRIISILKDSANTYARNAISEIIQSKDIYGYDTKGIIFKDFCPKIEYVNLREYGNRSLSRIEIRPEFFVLPLTNPLFKPTLRYDR